jgi:hypothetical protein
MSLKKKEAKFRVLDPRDKTSHPNHEAQIKRSVKQEKSLTFQQQLLSELRIRVDRGAYWHDT